MSTSWLCGFGGWVGLEGLKILQFQFLLTSRRAVRGKVWEVDGCWCVLEDGDLGEMKEGGRRGESAASEVG